MASLPKLILAEKENVEETLRNLQEAMARKDKSVVELAAMGTFLHNVYNGAENILKQVLKAEGIEIPRSDAWHKDVLNLAVSQGIVSEELADKLYEYLTFRHFFVHAYGFMLDEARLDDLANSVSEVWSQFLSEVEKYQQLV